MSLLERRRELMMMGNDVPYQKVEYLKVGGNGTWINTLCAGGDGLEIECKYLITTHSGYGAWWGNYINESYNVYRMILQASSSNNTYGYANGIASSGIQWGGGAKNVIHTVVVNEQGAVVDGVGYRVSPNKGTANTTNIAIFARGSYGGNVVNIGQQFYYFKIRRNGVLERDFVPVRVGTTGYMYDKVSKQLFGNAGSGNFILGNDIN